MFEVTSSEFASAETVGKATASQVWTAALLVCWPRRCHVDCLVGRAFERQETSANKQIKGGNSMKRILALAVLGAVLAGPVYAQDATKDATAAYAAWDAAFNKSDPAVLASAYAEDALFLAPDHVVRKGPDDVKEFFGGLFKNGVTGHKLTLIEADGDGDLVYATANWKAQAKGSDGAMSEIGGIGTHIFERQQDGSLKLKLHTFN